MRSIVLCGFCLLMPMPASWVMAQEVVLLFGRNATGQIKCVTDFPQPILLPVSIYRGVPGYARADIGLHSTFLDEPAHDFFQFSPDADFQFVLLAKSRGMEVWNDHGSAFLPVGGTFFVGPSQFDTHPMWNIPNLRQIGSLALSLKLHDMNGIYSDSDPITLSFKPANAWNGLTDAGDPLLPTQRTLPEPGQALTAVCAVVLFARRRGRARAYFAL